MSDWYCSSAAYAGYAAWQASQSYSVGAIIVPTAPALKQKWVFRCTTAGTSGASQPNFAIASSNNSTITDGGVTWTNISGQSAYFWTAAAGDLQSLLGGSGGGNWFNAGDRIFVSSDHAETQTSSSPWGAGTSPTSGWAIGQILSVNRAGSTPPVLADLTSGATVTQSAALMFFEAYFPVYHYGITYVYTATSQNIFFNSGSYKTNYFDTCNLYLNNTGATRFTTNNPASVVLKNTTLQFGATTQGFGCAISYAMDVTWLGTANAIAGAIFPTTLFSGVSSNDMLTLTCRGVDLSAITGTLVGNQIAGSKILFDSCKIASAVIRYGTSGVANTRDIVELVNCYDGTNIVNERYMPAGTLTTERTITLTSGTQDDVGSFSHKLVTTANVDSFVNPCESFWLDVENTLVGTSRTASVEIISSASLNNNDIIMYLEYQGTSSSSVATIANSYPLLTTVAAVPTSTAAWNSSPATPVKQHLQITFTPQVAGRVRAQVRFGKPSTTVYVNPQITIT